MKALKLVSKALTASVKLSGKGKARFKDAPILASAEFDYTKEATSDHFTAGFGKEPIMPPDITRKTYWVAGYNMYNPASGILDTLYAHAIWIDDNSGKGAVVFVSLDAVGLLKTDADIIKASLAGFAQETNIRNINILCTHDHAGIDTMGIWGPLPKTGRSKEFMQIVKQGVISAVKKAYEDRRNGSLMYGTIEVPDLQSDIRTPVVFSKTLTRLRFVPDDGSREIYFINFASHSESLTGKNSLISADFPAYLRKEILEKANAETIYFVGAIGGMITIKAEGKEMSEKIESVKKIGKKLGQYAMSIENERKLSPKISFIKQEFYFEPENTVLMTAAQMSILNVNPYFSKETPLGYLLKSEISYFEIDDVKLLLLPGETFPEVVYGGYLESNESATGLPCEFNPTPLVDIIGDKNTIIFNLANDEVGYIIPPNDYLLSEDFPYLERAKDRFDRNHYEETNSLGPKTHEKIATVVGGIMETVRQTKEKA